MTLKREDIPQPEDLPFPNPEWFKRNLALYAELRREFKTAQEFAEDLYNHIYGNWATVVMAERLGYRERRR